MKEILENKYQCTGCTACASLCPKEAITMEYDSEGFLYPKIDTNRCIDCGLCRKRCPVLAKSLIKREKESFFAYCTNNNSNWKNSTSGGAFFDICMSYTKKMGEETLIYGAFMDEEMKVRHICTSMKDIQKIQKSKYVHSDLRGIFVKVKENLENDIPVIFCGTPCQIHGLKKFLVKNYNKLLCIDFICHGVGSQYVFDKSIAFLENALNHKIVNYQFRYKKSKNYNQRERYNVLYALDNGKKLEEKDDLYMYLFLNELCLRKCCGHNCQFKPNQGVSDFTLADFNNKSKVFPKLYDTRNYSTIVLHNPDYDFIIEELKGRGTLIACQEEDILINNKLYKENAPECIKREDFFRDFSNGLSISELKEKYYKEKKEKIDLNRYIPYFIKYMINNIIRRK